MRDVFILPGQGDAQMLAGRRQFLARPTCSNERVDTPILIPSFSSKGFPDLRKIVQFTSEVLTDVTLVSAYDIHYEHLPDAKELDFTEYIFLDSGGYEASRDYDYSDAGYTDHEPKKWSKEAHEGVLDGWPLSTPTILVSYDHPNHRVSVADQIESATALANKYGNHQIELLLKPETRTQHYLNIDNFIPYIERIGDFPIVGVTEKELGSTHYKRMRSIAKLRSALDEKNIDRPIHVFGSLDPISTPLYFLAGADIFDGLTWLRFAYRDGLAIYIQNQAVLREELQQSDSQAQLQTWFRNNHQLQDLRLTLCRYVKTGGDFSVFPHHNELFRKAYEQLKADI